MVGPDNRNKLPRHILVVGSNKDLKPESLMWVSVWQCFENRKRRRILTEIRLIRSEEKILTIQIGLKRPSELSDGLLFFSGLHRHDGFDVRMRIIVQPEVFKFSANKSLTSGLIFHGRQASEIAA